MRIRIEVGVLGATGMVGQQFINQLASHPWFDLKWLAASERSSGKRYAEAAPWRLETPIPDGIGDRAVEAATPGVGPRLVFSALDAGVAGDLERAFADAGHLGRTARVCGADRVAERRNAAEAGRSRRPVSGGRRGHG